MSLFVNGAIFMRPGGASGAPVDPPFGFVVILVIVGILLLVGAGMRAHELARRWYRKELKKVAGVSRGMRIIAEKAVTASAERDRLKEVLSRASGQLIEYGAKIDDLRAEREVLQQQLEVATDALEEYAEMDEAKALRIYREHGGELLESHARDILGQIKKLGDER